MSKNGNKGFYKKKLETVLKKFNNSMKNSNFSIWFANSDFYIKNETIIINLGNEFALDFVSNTYLETLQKLTEFDIELQIDSKVKNYQGRLENKEVSKILGYEPKDQTAQEKAEVNEKSSDPENEAIHNAKDIHDEKEIQDKKDIHDGERVENKNVENITTDENNDQELVNDNLIFKDRKDSYNNEEPKKIEEINVDNVLRDIDKSMFSASIPRKVYVDLIQSDFEKIKKSHNKGKLTKVDLLVYVALCFKVNNVDGLVKNITAVKLASFINHSSHSKVVQSLHKLDNLDLININKTNRPYTYTIKGYEDASKPNSKGFINITYKLYQELTKSSLRQIRGVLWLTNHRYHLEDKEIMFTPNIGSLAKVMNARCFREALGLLSKLEGNIFKLIDKLKETKRLSFFDKFKVKTNQLMNNSEKISSMFDKAKLGIGSIVQPTKQLLDIVLNSLKDVNIPTTQDNIRKAIGLACLLPIEVVHKAQKICQQDDTISEHRTISFYTGLLQKLYNWFCFTRDKYVLF